MAVKVGIQRPFRMSSHGDIATASGDELRKSQIGLLLALSGTSAGMVGELEWDHRRGNRLEPLRNAMTSPAFCELAIIHCGDTLADIMPDEQLVGCDATVDGRTVELVVQCQRVQDRSKVPRPLAVTITIKA